MPVDLHHPVRATLDAVLDAARPDTSGAVASYIPELANVEPERLGIALVSTRGDVHDAGDSDVAFTIQSVSKPFVFALALDALGVDEVTKHVGLEPSGEPFNAISLDESGRPANPLINAGAIVTTSLIPAADADERYARVRDVLSRFAGRELDLDDDVYRSEATTGHRNRALAGLTLAAGVLGTDDVDDATDPYFRQCSLLVSATDLALMGATLANNGVHPLTREQVVDARVARDTLSLMATCGMYDRSGAWVFRVGMPAKSGVGGGIVAVKPGEFGVGVFSPPLDAAGNSSRGVALLELLSERSGLHMFDHTAAPPSPMGDITVGEAEAEVTMALRGELDFVAMEQVVHDARRLVEFTGATTLRLDLEAVTRVAPVAERLLRAMVQVADAAGLAVLVVNHPAGAP